MIGAIHELDRRAQLTIATLAHFRNRPFVWGTCDCVKIAIWHVRQFGLALRLAKVGSYKTAIGARAALKRAGFASLADALDANLLPIAPAEVLIGDSVMGESGDCFGALGIYLGSDAMLAFHEDMPGAGVLRRIHLDRAWRVHAPPHEF